MHDQLADSWTDKNTFSTLAASVSLVKGHKTQRKVFNQLIQRRKGKNPSNVREMKRGKYISEIYRAGETNSNQASKQWEK